MNRDKQPKRRPPVLRVYLLAAFALTIWLGVANSTLAQSQWTTNGNDISNTNTGNVGVGTPAPYNRFHATAVLYNTGTASQSGNIVTGVGTNWNWTMPGNLLVFSDGTKRTISGFIGPTSMTVLESGTVSSKSYTIYHSGFNVSATGNVGVGTATFKPWLQAFKTLQLGGNSALTSHQLAVEGSSIMMVQNGYIETDPTWKYIANATASRYYQINGTHVWQVAPPGTAESTINWKTGLAVDNNGNVGMGTTAPVFSGNNAKFVAVDAGSGTWSELGLGGNQSGADANLGVLAFVNSNRSTTEKRNAAIVGRSMAGVTNGALDFYTANAGTLGLGMSINYLGNVGVGTISPTYKLDVTGAIRSSSGGFVFPDGTVQTTAATGTVSTISAANVSAGQFGQNTGGGDFSFPANLTVAGNLAAKYQDVAEWVPARRKLAAGTVVVLDTEQSNQVTASTHAYDTKVAGVVSARPGLVLGEAGENKAMVATTGRVKVKVDATRAPIKVGDLLVTSEKEGLAMKSEPLDLGGTPIHRPGTLIGKALEPLEKGTGEILVLLSLQ